MIDVNAGLGGTQPTARYIIPVSRNKYPSFFASIRPTLDFPEATGPSIVITFGSFNFLFSI